MRHPMGGALFMFFGICMFDALKKRRAYAMIKTGKACGKYAHRLHSNFDREELYEKEKN